MSHVPTSRTCLRALRAHIPYILRTFALLHLTRPPFLECLTYFRFLYVPYVPYVTCFHFVHACICLHFLRALVSSFATCFKRPYFFTILLCLLCLHALPSEHSSWWRCLEDVLKTSFVFVFRRRLQDVFKTSWSRPIY